MQMARESPSIRRFLKSLTLTQISVITGIVASVVGTLAVLGLVGGDGDSQAPTTQADEVELEARRPVPDAVYSGTTAQGNDMHFQVWVDGRSLRNLTVPLEGECTDGGPFTSTYRQGGVARTIVITGGILSGYDTIHGATGEIVSGIFRISGRFHGDSGGMVTGQVSEHAEIRDGTECDTEQIKFTAAVLK
jgi:hypothetical protein